MNQEQVIAEKIDLDDKRLKLGTFIESATFLALPAVERDRLQRQAIAMTAYSDVLGERAEVSRKGVCDESSTPHREGNSNDHVRCVNWKAIEMSAEVSEWNEPTIEEAVHMIRKLECCQGMAAKLILLRNFIARHSPSAG